MKGIAAQVEDACDACEGLCDTGGFLIDLRRTHARVRDFAACGGRLAPLVAGGKSGRAKSRAQTARLLRQPILDHAPAFFCVLAQYSGGGVSPERLRAVTRVADRLRRMREPGWDAGAVARSFQAFDAAVRVLAPEVEAGLAGLEARWRAQRATLGERLRAMALEMRRRGVREPSAPIPPAQGSPLLERARSSAEALCQSPDLGRDLIALADEDEGLALERAEIGRAAAELEWAIQGARRPEGAGCRDAMVARRLRAAAAALVG